jgi:hypothetical protein
MGNIQTDRLLDPRYLPADAGGRAEPAPSNGAELFPVVMEL